MTEPRGRFVAFEGGEAAGKSTQALRLAERVGALLTREPGGTPIGEQVRLLLLDPAGEVDPRTEALLMAAARAQHVRDVIEPALADGRHVVTDRFTASSLAYQGHGRGLPLDEVLALSRFATGGLEPDRYVLLDLPAGEASGRRDRAHDRMESAGAEFHQRVREAFLTLAAADPARWLVVDGTRSIEEVGAAVWTGVSGLFANAPQ